MRTRRPTPEHQAAVSRRLALLSAELAGQRPEAPTARPSESAALPAADGSVWWSAHTRVAERPRLEVVPDVEPDWTPEPTAGWEPAWAPEWSPEPEVGPGAVQDSPWGPWTPIDVPPPPLSPAFEPAEVAVPGRHAARRARVVLAAGWPDTLRGRVALGPAQLTWVAVLVAAGLALAAWWVVHRDASPPQAVSVSTAPSAPLVALPTGTASGAAVPGAVGSPVPGASPAAAVPVAGASTGVATTVTVDVEGKVRRPGIAVLSTGSRVVDALKSAGGALPRADLAGLNLARVLVDGEQIVVGAPGGTAPAAVTGPGATGTGSTSGSASGAPVAMVDLNTATEEQLESLPQIGPVTAASILAWRQENGAFTSVDELLEVDGIGQATLDQVSAFVTI